MPAEAARQLHVVDVETGAVLDGCPECEELRRRLETEKSDRLKWAAKYQDAVRDNEAAARDHPLWPRAVRLFDVWKRECGHPNSEWSLERFDQCRPRLKKHGVEMCVRAIYGKAYDPYVTTRKNGTKNRHDGWHLIFEKAEKFEEAANCAPLDRLDEIKAEAEQIEGRP